MNHTNSQVDGGVVLKNGFMFHDIIQNEELWYAMRGSRYTSSNGNKIMASSRDYSVVALGKTEFAVTNNKTKSALKARFEFKVDAEAHIQELMAKTVKGSFADSAMKYAGDIALEQITGTAIASNYSSGDMERGHAEEPYARALYEKDTFCSVDNGGFFCNEFVGCSPDGLVGDDGVIEIKSAIPSVHRERVRKQSYDSAYKWQLIGNLHFTGREWIDFISYCSSYPEGKRLFVVRLWAKDLQEEFTLLDDRLEDFKDLVLSAKDEINNGVYINIGESL